VAEQCFTKAEIKKYGLDELSPDDQIKFINEEMGMFINEEMGMLTNQKRQ